MASCNINNFTLFNLPKRMFIVPLYSLIRVIKYGIRFPKFIWAPCHVSQLF